MDIVVVNIVACYVRLILVISVCNYTYDVVLYADD